MRRARPIAYAIAAILAASLAWHEHAAPRPADKPALFHPDPQHVSNRLYRALHVRTAPDGKQYGFDTLDPLLWSETSYLLEGKSHQQAIALADEFLRTNAARQITDPLKRAILQRDVWAVLDWADEQVESDLPHQPERRELISRLAPIVRSLALSPEELATLPDTFSRALQLREFPAAYDSANPNHAFLPPDLFDAHGPWVCLSPPAPGLAAPLHDMSFTARSVFLVFARLPGGRDATLAYFKQLADMEIPLFVRMKDPNWPQPTDVWNPQVPQFPAGTEFALVRKLVLPDRDGRLHVTSIVESVQIRHYTDIPHVDPMASRDVNLAQHFQAPSEIELSRTLLFSGNHSGLRGVTASDDPFLIFPAMSNGSDEVEDTKMRAHPFSPFINCTGCHIGPGIQSMMSFSFRGNASEGPVLSPRLAETTPNDESEKVTHWAQTQQKERLAPQLVCNQPELKKGSAAGFKSHQARSTQTPESPHP
ncbi:MAG: hypothetical protein WAN72_04155 [Candidatus Acidiferrales bacterium]